MSIGACEAFGALATVRGGGVGVGFTATGRCGPAFCFPAFPAGPGEPMPVGPGDGAAPFVCAIVAPCVGLGLGTPGFGAGELVALGADAGDEVGAAVAFAATATAVGAGLGDAGAGVCGFAVGAAVGCGGRGDGFAVGAVVGIGVGAAVGGTVTATATAAAVGADDGTAGSSFCGCGSYVACVGWTFGCGVACGSGVGFGGAVGANFESS